VKPIAIFYHTLFFIDGLLPGAESIIAEQMGQLMASGLLKEATEFHVGINGGEESKVIAALNIPSKAQFVFHGLSSRAENLTIVMLENWVKNHPGWNVLYFHAKGATHHPGTPYAECVSAPWRRAMMQDLVTNWQACVENLETCDIVCSRWLWHMGHDRSQHIPAGNFLWITSDFAAKLPGIHLRQRIKDSGIGGLESRYEAEVYWGNGPTPKVKAWRPNGGGGIP
jgi:hypothetical protein